MFQDLLQDQVLRGTEASDKDSIFRKLGESWLDCCCKTTHCSTWKDKQKHIIENGALSARFVGSWARHPLQLHVNHQKKSATHVASRKRPSKLSGIDSTGCRKHVLPVQQGLGLRWCDWLKARCWPSWVLRTAAPWCFHPKNNRMAPGNAWSL